MIKLLPVLCAFVLPLAAAPYAPNEASLSKHEAAPEWLKDAKLGIYFHWGPYSVPAYGNEWYPRHMHMPSRPEHAHHLETYGDPAEFGYHDFVPMFTGAQFDPEDWADLFQRAGAKFAGPVAEHHDGYAMWDSKVTPWNAKDTGPRRDILGELFESLEARGMKTIATFHHARNLGNRTHLSLSHYPNVNPDWPPASEDPKLRLLYGNIPEAQWLEQMWLGKLVEVVDQYQPDIIWFDTWLDQIPEDYRNRFAAYYLNAAEAWGKPVAIIRKQDDLPLSYTINDHEKSREPKALPELWMTDDTISTGSWCYTEKLQIKSLEKVVHALVDTVAKNGVVLLNLSPRADGIIPQDQREVLLQLGAWLKVNAEGIYDTRPWVIAAEGPTVEPEGGFSRNKEFLKLQYTAKDIRFTRSKDGQVLYAIVLGWPGDSVLIESFTGLDAREVKSVQLLGANGELRWEPRGMGMQVDLPQRPEAAPAYTLRVELNEPQALH